MKKTKIIKTYILLLGICTLHVSANEGLSFLLGAKVGYAYSNVGERWPVLLSHSIEEGLWFDLNFTGPIYLRSEIKVRESFSYVYKNLEGVNYEKRYSTLLILPCIALKPFIGLTLRDKLMIGIGIGPSFSFWYEDRNEQYLAEEDQVLAFAWGFEPFVQTKILNQKIISFGFEFGTKFAQANSVWYDGKKKNIRLNLSGFEFCGLAVLDFSKL